MIAFSSKILYFILALALQLAGYGNNSFNIDIISGGNTIESYSVERSGQYSYFTGRNGKIQFELEQSSSYAQVYTVFLPADGSAEAVNIEEFIRELRPFEEVPHQEISFEAESAQLPAEAEMPPAEETSVTKPREIETLKEAAEQENSGRSAQFLEEDPLSGTKWLFAKSGNIIIVTVTGAQLTLIIH